MSLRSLRWTVNCRRSPLGTGLEVGNTVSPLISSQRTAGSNTEDENVNCPFEVEL